MFGGIGFTEIILILVILVVIFGGNKLPGLGEGLGKMIRNFKRASSEPDEIDVTRQAQPPLTSKNNEKEQPPKQ